MNQDTNTYPYVCVFTNVITFSNEPSKIPSRRALITTKIHNTILSDAANNKPNKHELKENSINKDPAAKLTRTKPQFRTRLLNLT